MFQTSQVLTPQIKDVKVQNTTHIKLKHYKFAVLPLKTVLTHILCVCIHTLQLAGLQSRCTNHQPQMYEGTKVISELYSVDLKLTCVDVD